MYCKVCNNNVAVNDYFCCNKDCKFIRIFIRKYGIKKLKEILEIKLKPSQHHPLSS